MKLKSHKATQKRLRRTKSGKFLRGQAASSHLLTHKRGRSNVLLKISASDKNKVKKLAPYL